MVRLYQLHPPFLRNGRDRLPSGEGPRLLEIHTQVDPSIHSNYWIRISTVKSCVHRVVSPEVLDQVHHNF